MSLFDIAGLVGAFLMLGAYVAAQLHRLDPLKAPALAINVIGAGLVLVSLTKAFNLPAAIVEGSWALIALWGLIRIALRSLGLRKG